MSPFLRSFLLAALLAFGAIPATATDREYKVLGPSGGEDAVAVYVDSETEELAGMLERGAFPLEAKSISPNLTIYIETKGLSGWVSPFEVEVSFDPGDIGPCNFNFGTGEAAPRSIGKNCKNEKK